MTASYLITRYRWPSILALAAFLTIAEGAMAEVIVYSYDGVGRLATAFYGGSKCIAYTYDANGNRLTQSASSGSSTSAVWGSGVLGCFQWGPP